MGKGEERREDARVRPRALDDTAERRSTPPLRGGIDVLAFFKTASTREARARRDCSAR